MTEPVNEAPFGTETEPGTAAEPAPVAEPEPAQEEEAAEPEAVQHPPSTAQPAVPEGQPFWLAEIIQGFHDRLAWLEKPARGH